MIQQLIELGPKDSERGKLIRLSARENAQGWTGLGWRKPRKTRVWQMKVLKKQVPGLLAVAYSMCGVCFDGSPARRFLVDLGVFLDP